MASQPHPPYANLRRRARGWHGVSGRWSGSGGPVSCHVQRFASRIRARIRHRRRGDDPVRSPGRTRGEVLEATGFPPRPIASAIRPPSLPGLIRRGRRSSAGVLERLENALAGVRRGGLAGRRNRSCGSAGVAPSVFADLRHSRFECGNALFSSLKPNRGERIRTFDLLVPNQAL